MVGALDVLNEDLNADGTEEVNGFALNEVFDGGGGMAN